jgi:hypothetical protein
MWLFYIIIIEFQHSPNLGNVEILRTERSDSHAVKFCCVLRVAHNKISW